MARKKPPEPQAPADPLADRNPHRPADSPFSLAAELAGAPPPPEGAKPPPSDAPAPGARPIGRPSGFTQETADAICADISSGLSLRAICAKEGMPAQSMVYRWLQLHLEFREQYRVARMAQAEHFVDEIMDIADDARNDFMEREGKDGSIGYALNGEHISRSKARIEARMWLAGKLAPKVYGDKLQLSNDPDNPVGDKHLTVVEVKVQLLEGLGLKKVTDGTGG